MKVDIVDKPAGLPARSSPNKKLPYLHILLFLICMIPILGLYAAFPHTGYSYGQYGTNAKFKAVSSAHSHTAALMSDGTVWTWGSNQYDQLGYDTANAEQHIPRQVAGLPRIVSVAAGGNPDTGSAFTVALGEDGYVYAWGDNTKRQLGNGTTAAGRLPAKVLSSAGIPLYVPGAAMVAAGFEHAGVLTADGKVMTWGDNTYGQLGNPAGSGTVYFRTAVDASGGELQGIDQISFGAYHSLALEKADGSVLAWGRNHKGQLGTGDTTDSASAGKVKLSATPSDYLLGAVQVSAGNAYSAAILSDGVSTKMVSWGDNAFGQLGNGDTGGTPSPLPADFMIDASTREPEAVKVAAGGNHSVVQVANRAVTVGANDAFQLGVDGTASSAYRTEIKAPGSMTGVTGVIAGDKTSYALTGDGQLWAWGSNQHGLLGTGMAVASSATPVRIAFPVANFTVTNAVNRYFTGTTTDWRFSFAPHESVTNAQYIDIKIPSGFTFLRSPQPADVSVRIDAATTVQPQTVSYDASTHVLRLIMGGEASNIISPSPGSYPPWIEVVSGVIQSPAAPGAYTFELMTEAEPVPAFFTLNVTKPPIRDLSVTVTNAKPNGVDVGYTVSFVSENALPAGQEITVDIPDDYSTAKVKQITINGQWPTSSRLVPSNAYILTLPQTINAGQKVDVAFLAQNPPTTGAKEFVVSVDATYSLTYLLAIQTTAAGNLTVTPSPASVYAKDFNEWTIAFDGTEPIKPGDTVTMEFPSGFAYNVDASNRIRAGEYSGAAAVYVNGVEAGAVTISGQKLTVQAGNGVPSTARVTVELKYDTVRNPSAGMNGSIKVSSSIDSTQVTAPVAVDPGTLDVVLTKHTAGTPNVGYTYSFYPRTTLDSSNPILLKFSWDFGSAYFPGSDGFVKINGQNIRYASGSGSDGKLYVYLNDGQSFGSSDEVTVEFLPLAGWRNPAAGNYTIGVGSLLDGSHYMFEALTIMPDPAPPTGSVTVNNGEAKTFYRRAQIQAAVSDGDGSGVDAFRYSVDGMLYTDVPPGPGFRTVLPSGSGIKTVKVYASDYAGNASEFTDTITYSDELDLAGITAAMGAGQASAPGTAQLSVTPQVNDLDTSYHLVVPSSAETVALSWTTKYPNTVVTAAGPNVVNANGGAAISPLQPGANRVAITVQKGSDRKEYELIVFKEPASLGAEKQGKTVLLGGREWIVIDAAKRKLLLKDFDNGCPSYDGVNLGICRWGNSGGSVWYPHELGYEFNEDVPGTLASYLNQTYYDQLGVDKALIAEYPFDTTTYDYWYDVDNGDAPPTFTRRGALSAHAVKIGLLDAETYRSLVDAGTMSQPDWGSEFHLMNPVFDVIANNGSAPPYNTMVAGADRLFRLNDGEGYKVKPVIHLSEKAVIAGGDGTSQNPYTLAFRNSLERLSVTSGTMTQGLPDGSVMQYDIVVSTEAVGAALKAALPPDAAVAVEGAAYTVNGSELTVTLPASPFLVTVTAEDGSSSQYKFTVTRFVPSDDKGLSLRSSVSDAVYLAQNGSFSFVVPSGTETISFTPLLGASASIQVTAGGTLADGKIVPNGTLRTGSNVITATVTAQNGTTQEYRIEIMRTYALNIPGAVGEGMKNIWFDEGIRIDLPNNTISPAAQITASVVSPNLAGTTMVPAGRTLDLSASGIGVSPDHPILLQLPVNPPADPARIGIFHYRPSSGAWEYLPTQIESGIASALVGGPSIYGVFEAERVAQVTAAPGSGEVLANTVLQLSTATVGAAVYYTLDGTPPTRASTPYAPANQPKVTAPVHLQAVAVKSGMIDSGVSGFDYTVRTANTKLQSLTSSHALSPAFDPNVVSYTVTVSSNVYQFTFTPVLYDPANAVMKINGVSQSSGVTQSVYMPSPGSYPVGIVITDAGGSNATAYSITVVKAGSGNTEISGIGYGGTPLPRTGDTFSLTVDYTVASEELTVQLADPSAAFTVTGAVYGSSWIRAGLNEGDNRFAIRVTAQNGSVHAYTLSITRAPAPSADPELTAVRTVGATGSIRLKFNEALQSFADASKLAVSVNNAPAAITGVRVDAAAGAVIVDINRPIGMNDVIVVEVKDGAVKNERGRPNKAAIRLADNTLQSLDRTSDGSIGIDDIAQAIRERLDFNFDDEFDDKDVVGMLLQIGPVGISPGNR